MNASASDFESSGGSHYSLEILSQITGVSVQSIRFYQEQGLIHRTDSGGPEFDDDAVRALRRIDHLREAYGVEVSALKLLTGLLDEIEQLRAALRARR
ncbi:MAG TPA: MerR family transcriptional regulator [Verrucomicrobiaceae bacterium]|jgi:MerR family transcriptional regulator/heat shock protein HspR